MRGLWCVALMLGACANNPASPFSTRREARSLACRRLPEVEASEQYPGQVPAPMARGANWRDVTAMVCERTILEPDERGRRDEALLGELSSSVDELVYMARSAESSGDGVWHVDAFYPDEKVASKIAVAARTTLVAQGARVSDRVPVLAAGDVMVLTRLRLKEALPLSCARYFAEGSLGNGERLLALMILDARETALHAGLCRDGEWRWLR